MERMGLATITVVSTNGEVVAPERETETRSERPVGGGGEERDHDESLTLGGGFYSTGQTSPLTGADTGRVCDVGLAFVISRLAPGSLFCVM